LEDLQVPYLKGTVIIPLMNGVENARIVSNRLNESVVLPACVYVASHVKGPGVIEHKGADGRIICGIDEQTNYDYSRISNFLSQSPVSFELLPDASIPIWKKFLFIASFGLMTARFNITFGELCASQSYKERAQAIAGEILEIAIANGVNLETSEARQIFDVAGAFPSTTRSSLQLDIHSGKDKNELDLFTDPIIRFGRAVGIRAREVESIRAEILALNQRSVL
ncbi:MAG TPA: ketopantoate reductase C-terminal domain-containing protein, partial [Chryseolinea sp.]